MKRIEAAESKINVIRIFGNYGDTFQKTLEGRVNMLSFLTFTSAPSDNPFSFDDGFVIAIHCSGIYLSTRFLLIGVKHDASIMEMKIFNFATADEPAEEPSI